MFNENLKAIRKARGFTQEELAIKLNVVRQTISKWEKGLSVPDVEMPEKIAEVLETDVSTLLGSEVNAKESEDMGRETALQLAKISEQLAIQNRRRKKIWKTIGIIIAVIIGVSILLSVAGMVSYNQYAFNETSVVVEDE